ncbi:MAG: RNA polymerase sigma factor [Tannerellaceae bacterium]|jgi:RNA polymerase sigma factor (sigma-70 family)|nr:RNA polymerase sigma factor [Tannerellaceae bacterium]
MNFNPSNSIDEQLVWQNFIAGDANAYAQLYDIYADKMYSYGCTITSDYESVKDCMMDIFVDIYDKRKSLKQVRNVRAFLLVSLKNRLIDKTRKHTREELTNNFTIHKTAEISVEEIFIHLEEKNEIRKKINSLLQTLSVRQREVIYFRYVEELPFEQIAGIMDMNYQSVRNLLHLTIRKMREKLLSVCL